jgi:aspartyl-tRNA(Asn)/glutamyl-tRNA(Gln) amidotransferase subunit B
MVTAATTHELSSSLMIGMEIHVELATRSKMFTSAPNVAHRDFDNAEPNSLVDPVVIGMPGTLPVVNRLAVEMSMLVGLALGCKIASVTKWDRKSYYYPDLPKNYQISQYDQPLCGEGSVEIPVEGGGTRTIRILRAHLEEDAGKLLHEAPGGHAIDGSIVDLNRAGTPLLEIVTYPDFQSAQECVTFSQMLRDVCRYLGVTQGIMQKGHIRFEPNINVIIQRAGQTYKTPIAEIKNLNSFKALQGSIEYEHHRQIEQWLQTGKVLQSGSKSTRGWDDVTQTTFLQREKEEAHDYRYFPDPDLVQLVIDDAWLSRVKSQLPELPAAKQKRYTTALGIGIKETAQILDDPAVCSFFEKIIAAGVEPKRAAALLLNNLNRRANDRGVLASELGITAAQVAGIDQMSRSSQISSNGADTLIGLCCENPAADPLALAQQNSLLQVSDESSLDAWVDEAIAANPKSVESVKAGKEAAIGAIVGAVMKLSKGKANPKIIGDKLRAKLLG